MTSEFNDQIEKLIGALQESVPEIHYQAFDFSHVNDSRSQLMKLNYDKSKVSFLNLEMVADMFQVFTAVHSAVESNSSRDFGVEVLYRLSNTRSIGDALRVFGGFGKAYVVVVSIDDRLKSEELFTKISQIEHVKKMSSEQMQDCMKSNLGNTRRYYFGTTSDEEQATYGDPIGEIVTKMISSKNL